MLKKIQLLSLLAVFMLVSTAAISAPVKKDKKKSASKEIKYEYASFEFYKVVNAQLYMMAKEGALDMDQSTWEQMMAADRGKSTGKIVINPDLLGTDYQNLRSKPSVNDNPDYVLNLLVNKGWVLSDVSSTAMGSLIVYQYIIKKPAK